ncbi:DUF305 domain-containing protein [Streptomyces sp. NPDC002643]
MSSYARFPRRMPAVTALAVAALLLTACGGGGDDAGAQSADFNDADVAFAQMMIPHHEQALEMARLADGRASDSEVKDLAAKVEQAQDPEIETMTGWLRSWDRPTSADSMPGMDHGDDGMMSDADMTELKAMKGTEFDKMFAQMMIEHHEGAIATAKDEQKDGENADAKKMADDIVAAQSAEVKQLEAVLERL